MTPCYGCMALNEQPQLGTISGQCIKTHTLVDVSDGYLLYCLRHYEGDKQAAALRLGISLKTLYNRIKRRGWANDYIKPQPPSLPVDS